MTNETLEAMLLDLRVKEAHGPPGPVKGNSLQRLVSWQIGIVERVRLHHRHEGPG